jgi:predicted TPR repeat methyltransferase
MNRQQRRVQEKQNRKNRKSGHVDLLPRAIQHHREGRLAEAETIYRHVLAAVPERVEACHFLGVLLHQKGKSMEAAALIRRAIEASPDYLDAHNNLGNVYFETGEMELAIDRYRKVIELAPAFADAHNNLAIALKEQALLDEALGHARRAVELAPDRADFYHTLGNVHRKRGETQLSADACRKSISLKPYQADAYKTLWRTFFFAGEFEEAGKVLEQWLAIDPNNAIARHTQASFKGGALVPERASDDYVQQTFDSFASSFDKVLERLEYRAPTLVADAVAAQFTSGSTDLAVLDAGCGTGLCGPLIRPYAARLVGVDLSPGMLERAESREIYDELAEAELVLFLESRPGAFDLIVSADVLVYFGDLAPFAKAAAESLKPGGRLIFTVEKGPSDQTFQLNIHGRYSHGLTYVEDVLKDAGLTGLSIRDEILRKERGEPVHGLLVSAER